MAKISEFTCGGLTNASPLLQFNMQCGHGCQACAVYLLLSLPPLPSSLLDDTTTFPISLLEGCHLLFRQVLNVAYLII